MGQIQFPLHSRGIEGDQETPAHFLREFLLYPPLLSLCSHELEDIQVGGHVRRREGLRASVEQGVHCGV